MYAVGNDRPSTFSTAPVTVYVGRPALRDFAGNSGAVKRMARYVANKPKLGSILVLWWPSLVSELQ